MYWKMGPREIVGFKVNFIEYFHNAKQRRMIFFLESDKEDLPS
jgi:hypothetical protein